MAIIHFSRREVEARVVYWGPALSGKTTSLRSLHDFTPRGRRGDLETLDTQEERTLYFDYLPLMWGTIAGFKGRVKILGVPGQSMYRETRRLLLQGADGVVFVADSHPDQLSANVESLNELQRALSGLGRGLDEIPLVLQYNKRDLPKVLATKVLDMALNARGVQAIATVATQGQGIAEAFQAILEAVSDRVEREVAGGAGEALVRGSQGAAPVGDKEEVREVLDAIAKVRPGELTGTAETPPAATELEKEEPLEEDPPTSEIPDPDPERSPASLDSHQGDRRAVGTATDDTPTTTQAPATTPTSEIPSPPQSYPDSPNDLSQPAYAIVTLPYLPRALSEYELHSVADSLIEQDGTVMVRMALSDPRTGRLRRVRVRLVPEARDQPTRAFEPEPPPTDSRVGHTLLALAVGFGLGAAVVWVFLS